MKELKHFSATWCRPCKQMEPMIKKFLEENPDVVYTKYDADTDTPTFYEFGITGVPTFIVNNNGKSVSHTGVATPEKFAELFD